MGTNVNRGGGIKIIETECSFESRVEIDLDMCRRHEILVEIT